MGLDFGMAFDEQGNPIPGTGDSSTGESADFDYAGDDDEEDDE
jgi:hypothetical protein